MWCIKVLQEKVWTLKLWIESSELSRTMISMWWCKLSFFQKLEEKKRRKNNIESLKYTLFNRNFYDNKQWIVVGIGVGVGHKRNQPFPCCNPCFITFLFVVYVSQPCYTVLTHKNQRNVKKVQFNRLFFDLFRLMKFIESYSHSLNLIFDLYLGICVYNETTFTDFDLVSYDTHKIHQIQTISMIMMLRSMERRTTRSDFYG